MCSPDRKHQLRVNVSNSAVLPSDFREVLQRRLGELERQLLLKVAELEDEKSLLHNETSAHRQKTESALNALLQRVTELERGECFNLFLCRPLSDILLPPAVGGLVGGKGPCSWLQFKGSWAGARESKQRARASPTAILCIYGCDQLGLEGVVAPTPAC